MSKFPEEDFTQKEIYSASHICIFIFFKDKPHPWIFEVSPNDLEMT